MLSLNYTQSVLRGRREVEAASVSKATLLCGELYPWRSSRPLGVISGLVFLKPGGGVSVVAGSGGIAAVGKSIERVLNAAFKAGEPIEASKTRAVLVRTDDLTEQNAGTSIGSPALSIFLYRIDFNKTMRAAWSAVGLHDGRAHLALDLHYLLTAWAANAEYEHAILGRAIQCLEMTPIFGGPMLYPSSDWGPNECLQVVMEEISTEAVMRTFDSLPTDYRLSVPYIARVLRIDGSQAQPEVPVTTLVTGLTPSNTL